MERVKRETIEQFCNRVFNKARGQGCFAEVEPILDYASARCYGSDADLTISDYRFDFQAVVSFGSCEGIYIDCYVCGHFHDGQEDPRRVRCGTVKTLETSLEAMQMFGKLCGSLTYYADKVIRENIDLYSPEKETEAREARRKEKEK